MNQEKLEMLQAMQAMQRIGGKGTPRRVLKKLPTKAPPLEDKKLVACLSKLGAQKIDGVEECNMFQADGKVLHFEKPSAQYVDDSTFVINGNPNTKEIMDLLPNVLSQLGADQLASMRST